MNNKNNRTTNELVNLIVEEQALRDNKDFAYAYASGALIAIVEANRVWGDNIQDIINRQYEATLEEIEKLKMKQIQKVANSAKLEELYA